MSERQLPTKGSGHPWQMPEKPPANAPMCVAQVNILKPWEGGVRPELSRSQFAHYLVGEGKGEDGVLPEMFTSDDDPPSAFRDAWLRRDRSVDDREPGFNGKHWPLMQAWCADVMRRELYEEPRYFRVVVSPEQRVGRQMGKSAMQVFTRSLMRGVEEDCFRQFHWAASAHFNTDHPHVHIGIRGQDKSGRPVVLRARYVKYGFEWRARTLLAEMFPAEKKVRRAG